MRHRITLAAASLAALAGASLATAPAATADSSPGCVTLYEGQIVEAGWSKSYMHRHFGTNGDLVRRAGLDTARDSDDRLVRSYPRCNPDEQDVVVQYRKWWGAWAVNKVRGISGWGEALAPANPRAAAPKVAARAGSATASLNHISDAGFDDPIKVTCQLNGDPEGEPLTRRSVAEGQHSHTDHGCKDVEWVKVGAGQKVTCRNASAFSDDVVVYRLEGWNAWKGDDYKCVNGLK